MSMPGRCRRRALRQGAVIAAATSLDVEFERQFRFTGLGCREHYFAYRISEANGHRQAVVIQA